MLAVSIIALGISILALPFTAWAARAAARQAKAARDQTQIQRDQVAAAREQTELQRELARNASQPYVWADIQPDMQQGTVMHVVVGNSGPTVARNVKVTFEPGLPAGQQQSEKIESVQRTLASGLRSLAPGRVLGWSLGAGFDLLSSDVPQLRKVRVEGDGPRGSLDVLEFEIDITEWRQARDAPDGSLHHVRGAIKDLTKAVAKIDSTIKRAAPRYDSSAEMSFQLDELGDHFARREVVRGIPDGESEGKSH
ncbi:MAG TPA: hypothetical protein VIP98_02855 [Microlunatus sp.]